MSEDILETDNVTFPWRRVSGSKTYKRDTGCSKKSVETYGPLDLVFVHLVEDGWTAYRDEGGKVGPFPTAEEARDAADEAWPWWKGEGPAPEKAWWA